MAHRFSWASALLFAALLGSNSLRAQQQQASGIQPSITNPTEVMARGHLDGETAATNVGTGGWMTGGVVTGVLTGLIGTAVIWAIAGSSDVNVPADRKLLIASESAVY